jgi:hypothetical protein
LTAGLIGGLLCWRLHLTTEDRAIVGTITAPDREPQLEKLLAGLLVSFHALALLERNGQLMHQDRR